MTQPQVAPYGSWRSPISANLISTEGCRIIEAVADGEDIYWIEMRPTENGRYVIVRRTPDGQATDVTPSPFNARTRVHEYGGAAFVVHAMVRSTLQTLLISVSTVRPSGAEPQPITS